MREKVPTAATKRDQTRLSPLCVLFSAALFCHSGHTPHPIAHLIVAFFTRCNLMATVMV